MMHAFETSAKQAAVARSEKWANAISIVSKVRTFSIFAIACALYGREVVSSPQMWWPLSESGLSSGTMVVFALAKWAWG